MIFALSLSLWGIGRSFHLYLFCLQCSVTCDSGIKVRSVECSDKDFSCDARTKPQTTTQCNLKPCPRWKTSPWGEVNCYLHTNAKSRWNVLHFSPIAQDSTQGFFLWQFLRNKAFPYDLTSAMLAAMLVSQTSPVGVVLFSYVNPFFCRNNIAYLHSTWVKTLYRVKKKQSAVRNHTCYLGAKRGN